MYQSTTPSHSSALPSSEVVRDLAGQLRVHAEALEDVRARLRGAEDIGWESPAGRKFSTYLGERTWSVAAAASLLREAAVSLDAYSASLHTAEVASGSGL